MMNASPVAGTDYVDYSVAAGETYFYTVTAVDSFNNTSTYSNETTAVIPTP